MSLLKLNVAMLLLLTGGLTLQQPATAADSDNPLDVMSYNIRLATGKDGDDRWEVRKPRTFQVIKKYKPDVIGLQEAQPDQNDDLLEALPDYQMVGAGRTDGTDNGEYSSIMYDPDRLRVMRTDTFWLSDTPEVPGSTSWGNSVVRICTWAQFLDLETRKIFYLFNTHLDHISQPSREKSMIYIMKHINEMQPKFPVLFTGDFNAGEDNPVVKAALDGGYRDTFRELHPDVKEVGTTNGFKETRNPAKIDYVFVDDKWNVHESAIIDDKIDGRWPSDHLPVTASVSVK